jgi:N-acetylglucosamine-6-sulfatase
LFHLPDTSEWQLFDLEKDPQELKSVHDDPAYAKTRGEMMAIYHDLRTLYKAP